MAILTLCRCVFKVSLYVVKEQENYLAESQVHSFVLLHIVQLPSFIVSC